MMNGDIADLVAGFFTTSVLSGLVYGIPLMMLLRKAEMNQNIAFVSVVPVGALVLLWVLAFRRPEKLERIAP